MQPPNQNNNNNSPNDDFDVNTLLHHRFANAAAAHGHNLHLQHHLQNPTNRFTTDQPDNRNLANLISIAAASQLTPFYYHPAAAAAAAAQRGFNPAQAYMADAYTAAEHAQRSQYAAAFAAAANAQAVQQQQRQQQSVANARSTVQGANNGSPHASVPVGASYFPSAAAAAYHHNHHAAVAAAAQQQLNRGGIHTPTTPNLSHFLARPQQQQQQQQKASPSSTSGYPTDLHLQNLENDLLQHHHLNKLNTSHSSLPQSQQDLRSPASIDSDFSSPNNKSSRPLTGSGRGRSRGRPSGGTGDVSISSKSSSPMTYSGFTNTSAEKPKPLVDPYTALMNAEKNKPLDLNLDLRNPDDGTKWYTGQVLLGLEEDQFWLSELQVYLRSNFAEAFVATERDIAAPMHGRNKPIALGQVGIRCIHCRDEPPSERGQQAVSYPSLVSGIYNSVQQMFRLHFDCCKSMPYGVRMKIENLRASSSSRGGRKQYWIDSAKRLGLVDTPNGIRFARDPNGPLPPLSGPSAILFQKEDESTEKAKKVTDELLKDSEALQQVSLASVSLSAPSKPKTGEEDSDKALPSLEKEMESPTQKLMSLLSKEHSDEMKRQKEEAYPLVLPEDQGLISDYLYLTLEQMEPCKLMDADRVGCYKGRDMGFPGLACKHCIGQAGCGRYFPATEASLSQTTTSHTILNHVRSCRRCPLEIRENLEILRKSKFGPDGKKKEKPKHGGRKVFFHRLWCRIQGLPIEEVDDVEVKIGRQKGAKNKSKAKEGKRSSRRIKKKTDDDLLNSSDDDTDSDTVSDDDMDDDVNENDDSNDDDEKTDTEDEEEEENEDQEDEEIHVKSPKIHLGSKKRLLHQISVDDDNSVIGETTGYQLEDMSTTYEANLPLSRPDDINWLTDHQCFVRSELVEVFTATQDDLDEIGNNNIEVGQIGVRCKHCASCPSESRASSHSFFPMSLNLICSSVSDITKRHLSSCNDVPSDLRKLFTSLHKMSSKKVDGADTAQYWIDSARDLGIMETPSGLKFFRDPYTPSISETVHSDLPKVNKDSVLVTSDDYVTDFILLLMSSVRPCQFKNIDRRGGSGFRGRFRALGFPGLACIYCSSERNGSGRYFPVSAKSLADNTVNSIHSHLSSCPNCPEVVRASLAYLSHRNSIQKQEMGNGWKKSYFKDVWDRLHVHRNWSKKKTKYDDSASSHNHTSSIPHNFDADNSIEDDDDDKGDDNSDYDDEKLDEGMKDLVKEAADWLSERDAQLANNNHTILTSRGSRPLPCRLPKGGGVVKSTTEKPRRAAVSG